SPAITPSLTQTTVALVALIASVGLTVSGLVTGFVFGRDRFLGFAISPPHRLAAARPATGRFPPSTRLLVNFTVRISISPPHRSTGRAHRRESAVDATAAVAHFAGDQLVDHDVDADVALTVLLGLDLSVRRSVVVDRDVTAAAAAASR